MTNDRPRCVVIGIGNADRGDDAAGLAAARMLRSGVTAVPELDPGIGPIDAKSRFDKAAVVEAAASAICRSALLLPPWGEREPPAAGPDLNFAPKEPASVLHAPIAGAGRGAQTDLQVEQAGDGLKGVEIVEHSGEATALIAHVDGAGQVFLIDACVSGAPPGAIHRFDVGSAAMPALARGFSTHGFGPAEAVELARALGRLPRRSIVYAIEGASFETGAPLSPPVAAAVAEVVRRLRTEIAGTGTL